MLSLNHLPFGQKKVTNGLSAHFPVLEGVMSGIVMASSSGLTVQQLLLQLLLKSEHASFRHDDFTEAALMKAYTTADVLNSMYVPHTRVSDLELLSCS